MRNIEFRGKEIDTGKWVYGGLFKEPAPPQCFEKTLEDKYWIVYPNPRYMPDWNLPYEMVRTDVNPETVGQYTGLKDKNGREIYEGDIVLAPEWFGSLKCICIYQQENTVNPIQGFGLYSYDSYFRKYNTLVESDEWDEFEVIGNIYDNPELLEEGE